MQVSALDNWHIFGYNIANWHKAGMAMIVKTTIFNFCYQKYKSLPDLAQAMGISVSQIYRVREGKRHINQKFIVGATKAFPGYKLDDLFYLVPESPPSTSHQGLAALPRFSTTSINMPAGKRKLGVRVHSKR